MAKDLAIILNNGSINSAVATAIAAQKHRLILLWAEFGSAQKPSSRQRAAYDLQVAHFKPYREHTLAMPWVSMVQPHGAQTNTIADTRMHGAISPQMLELLPLLGAAARFAGHYNAAAIYLGLRVGGVGEELAQATEYVQIWNELLQIPCAQSELEIITPLLELDAWQVIDVGFQVGAPFDRTWSCTEDSSDPCWACRGCRARELSFQQSGKPDPMRVVRKI